MSSDAILSREITWYVRDHCLCLHAQRAARALARRFDEALRPFGLTSGQFSLMMSLNRPDPPTIGSVAALLALDRTTLTAALKPLERRALVEVRQHPRDRRSRVMRLTDAGRALLSTAVPTWEAVHASIEGSLQPGEGDRLRSSLNDVAMQSARDQLRDTDAKR